ncbi:Alpha/Beta hydrolase protein [Aspergillus alliaceus]|uniref:Alpha/Beta hydrolase protein n=1 Tax=Petromyces alliaceus TaxID=209559 RepID=A0A5N7BWV7_PETAA|nr:Alpha/Beta hydrolase protein [Aspergillus alliaceus]
MALSRCPLPLPEENPSYPGFHPSVTEPPAGHKRRENSRPLHQPMVFERDHALRLRDEIMIYADIYRPTDNIPVPAIMVWGPYRKSGGGLLDLRTFPLRVGVSEERLSGYLEFRRLDPPTNFMGRPDPAEWIPRGYAVVNVDARGAMDSEGDMRFWGSGDGQDGYDAIEEIAKLPWCNGKVALVGNSWLAISQWSIAAERPHVWRYMFGGFADGLAGPGRLEDILAMREKSALTNEYWEDKMARLDQIPVPAYILASYSAALHTSGSFRGYEAIPHDKKWLVIHGTQEWYDLYSFERIQELQSFFGRYMKDLPNGWETTPRIHPGYSRFYLGSEHSLLEEKPKEAGQIAYEANATPILQRGSDPGEISSSFRFLERTVLLGPSRAIVHIMSRQNDMNVYVKLRKAGRSGRLLQNLNIPLHDQGVTSANEVPLIIPLKYFGPQENLRASFRDVAEEWLGEPMRLEIDIWPTHGYHVRAWRTTNHEGFGAFHESVDFEDLQGTFRVSNTGPHTIFWEGQFESYLGAPPVDLPGAV